MTDQQIQYINATVKTYTYNVKYALYAVSIYPPETRHEHMSALAGKQIAIIKYDTIHHLLQEL